MILWRNWYYYQSSSCLKWHCWSKFQLHTMHGSWDLGGGLCKSQPASSKLLRNKCIALSWIRFTWWFIWQLWNIQTMGAEHSKNKNNCLLKQNAMRFHESDLYECLVCISKNQIKEFINSLLWRGSSFGPAFWQTGLTKDFKLNLFSIFSLALSHIFSLIVTHLSLCDCLFCGSKGNHFSLQTTSTFAIFLLVVCVVSAKLEMSVSRRKKNKPQAKLLENFEPTNYRTMWNSKYLRPRTLYYLFLPAESIVRFSS